MRGWSYLELRLLLFQQKQNRRSEETGDWLWQWVSIFRYKRHFIMPANCVFIMIKPGSNIRNTSTHHTTEHVDRWNSHRTVLLGGREREIQRWFQLIFFQSWAMWGMSWCDVRVETDLFYWVSIVVVLLSSQDLSEEMSSFNFHCQISWRTFCSREFFQIQKQTGQLFLIRDCWLRAGPLTGPRRGWTVRAKPSACPSNSTLQLSVLIRGSLSIPSGYSP